MPDKFLLYSLDVGQGMCTFFEHYNDKDELKQVALFDVGSTKNRESAGLPTLNFLARRIIARNPPDGYLDILFISHKDADHVNLIRELLKLVPKAGIGMVRYGGRYSWYATKVGRNILTELGERTGAPNAYVKGFPVGRSEYNSVTGEFGLPVWPGTNYDFYLLAANAPYKDEKVGTPEKDISQRPNGDQANSKSLVVAMQMGYTWSIISGDATFPTFQYINGIFSKQFLRNVMTLLPHHGSRKTTFGLSKTNGKISDQARLVVETFAARMAGQTIVASADTKHCHPSLETIDLFLKYTDQTTSWWSDPGLNQKHYVSAYVDMNFKSTKKIPATYLTYQTSQNVYSTLYYYALSKPTFSYSPFATPAEDPKFGYAFSKGMNWIYGSYSNSPATRLVGEPSGRKLDAVRLALLQAVPGTAVVTAPPRALPAAATTVTVRPPTHGAARAPATLPRRSSSFSHLVRVP
jgi:hypothetical protein